MGRSAMHPHCASSSAESSPSPNFSSPSSSMPFPSEPGKTNRNPRRRGGKTQTKAGIDPLKESDVKGKSRGSVPSQGQTPFDSSPSSRVPNDCSCAERPNFQQAGTTDSSPGDSFMVREGHASHSLDSLIQHAKHRVGVFVTFCKVCLTELSVEQKPRMDAFVARVMEWRCRVQGVIQHAWPPLRQALLIMGWFAAALTLAWLNCTMQGCKSFFSLGSAAFFVVVCCSTLNLGMLGGFFKLFVCLVFCAGAAFFVGYTYALVIFGVYSALMLWVYGSFWLTGGVIVVGGILFFANQTRPALAVVLLYSVYSAKAAGGWLGLFVCLNISFVLSSLMIYLLQSNDNDSSAQSSTRTTDGHAYKSNKNRTGRGRPSEASDATHNTDSQQDGLGTARCTANGNGEASAIDTEVQRLLSCKDHYAALELSRFAEVDLGALKREYKKKAMLVHPDKNLGNAVAEEAFKRLQNAYEVLLDPSKKQSYDEELKREEVISALKRFQQELFRNGRAGTSDNWFAHSEDEQDEDSATQRVVCKKCNHTHRWICTDRNKLHARWCQDCQDHHQAKDGDGWVEQRGQAFFFGMLRRVDVPQAYACADSKVYNVTEWVQCQGMKCIPNTHKPSFHVSTAGIFKSPPSRGPRTSRASAGNAADSFPFAHMNENMTEEEFRKWLENAMASGAFNDVKEAPGQEDAKSAGAWAKNSKRKRKGKGKW